MAFDLISIGDTVIDTFVPLKEAEVFERGGEKMLSMRFGDKIPVDPSISMVAGNAANNAVGSARLGLKTAIYTNVGKKDDDEADHRIINKFKKEKVDVRYVVDNTNLPSNHHIVLTFKGERTILIFHQPWKFDLPDLDKTKWIYLTSLSPSFTDSNLYEQIVNYIERNNPKLMYQPGTFQIKIGLKKNARLLSLAEVFIVNLEEAKLLLGFEMGQKVPIKKLLKGLADFGPRKVVITDGGNGSFGYDGEKYYQIGIFKADLVEITGSGDAYATGLLAGLFHGYDLPEAMRWGAADAASVVEQIGPQAGLLTSHGMQGRLKENPKVISKEI